MPKNVSDVYRPLRQEVANLHVEWSLFRQLFGTDEERIVLLNRAAAVLFGTVQRVLYDAVILSLFRLADPPATGRFENLCLDRLAAAVAQDSTDLAAAVRPCCDQAKSILSPYADLRNKAIAHNDLRSAQAQFDGEGNLTGPSRAEIEGVLGQIRTALNLVGSHYGEGETRYGEPILPHGSDGDALLAILRRAVPPTA